MSSSSIWQLIVTLLFGGSCKSERCGFLMWGRLYSSHGSNGVCSETCIVFGSGPPAFTCGTCDDSPDSESYNIDIAFGNVPTAHRSAFTKPKQRWESIIVADLPDVDSSTLSEKSSIGGCSYPNIIDDLHMCIFYDELANDGPQGGLAYAIVEHVREDATKLPVAGVIGFDPADVDRLINRGEMELVILHEMAHLIGLGVLWALVGVTGSVKENCPYKGKHANEAYRKISGCQTVPTELDGQANDGTFCSHFDEWCLQNDIMTGFLDKDSVISNISVASLQDIGYSVDYSKAGAFGSSDLGIGCACSRSRNLESTVPGVDEESIVSTKLPSDEARAIATTFGQGILRRHQNETSKRKSVNGVANQMVMVLVQDGDEIVNVVVHAG